MQKREIDEKELLAVNKLKTETRNKLDIAFMTVCITAFTLIASLKPEILNENKLFTLQLVSAIPLFMCALFSRIKVAYKLYEKKWDTLAFFSFTLAYGFLINTLGILLSFFTVPLIFLTFFGLNIVLDLARSSIKYSYGRNKPKDFMRVIVHVLLIVFLGILPALKVY